MDTRDCAFLRKEDASASTKYIDVDHANSNGAVLGCYFAHATNADLSDDFI